MSFLRIKDAGVGDGAHLTVVKDFDQRLVVDGEYEVGGSHYEHPPALHPVDCCECLSFNGSISAFRVRREG